MYIKKLFKSLIFIFSISFTLTSCNPGDARKIPPNVDDRVMKNIQEGRGFRFQDKGKNIGEFDFASSNELWRASLDTLEFMPFALANYSGGILVTDWYNDGSSANESVKISVRFLSNEVRSDAIDVDIFYKKCIATNNCKINKQDGQLKKEITKQILAKAAIYKKQSKDKNFKPYRSSSNDNERQE